MERWCLRESSNVSLPTTSNANQSEQKFHWSSNDCFPAILFWRSTKSLHLGEKSPILRGFVAFGSSKSGLERFSGTELEPWFLLNSPTQRIQRRPG